MKSDKDAIVNEAKEDQPELMTPDEQKAFVESHAAVYFEDLKAAFMQNDLAGKALQDLDEQRALYREGKTKAQALQERIDHLEEEERRLGEQLQAAIFEGRGYENILREKAAIREKAELLRKELDRFEEETLGKRVAQTSKNEQDAAVAFSEIFNRRRAQERLRHDAALQRIGAEAMAFNFAATRLFNHFRLHRKPLVLRFGFNRVIKQLMLGPRR